MQSELLTIESDTSPQFTIKSDTKIVVENGENTYVPFYEIWKDRQLFCEFVASASEFEVQAICNMLNGNNQTLASNKKEHNDTKKQLISLFGMYPTLSFEYRTAAFRRVKKAVLIELVKERKVRLLSKDSKTVFYEFIADKQGSK